jgi:hypothetical protein
MDSISAESLEILKVFFDHDLSDPACLKQLSICGITQFIIFLAPVTTLAQRFIVA